MNKQLSHTRKFDNVMEILNGTSEEPEAQMLKLCITSVFGGSVHVAVMTYKWYRATDGTIKKSIPTSGHKKLQRDTAWYLNYLSDSHFNINKLKRCIHCSSYLYQYTNREKKVCSTKCGDRFRQEKARIKRNTDIGKLVNANDIVRSVSMIAFYLDTISPTSKCTGILLLMNTNRPGRAPVRYNLDYTPVQSIVRYLRFMVRRNEATHIHCDLRIHSGTHVSTKLVNTELQWRTWTSPTKGPHHTCSVCNNISIYLKGKLLGIPAYCDSCGSMEYSK